MKAINKERDKIIIKKYFGEYAPTSRYNIEQPRVEVEIKNYGND